MKYSTDLTTTSSEMVSTSSPRACALQDDSISTLPFRRGGASSALPSEGADSGAAALRSTCEHIDGYPLTLQEIIDLGIDPDDLDEPSEDSDDEYYREADSYKALIKVVKDMQTEGIPSHLPKIPEVHLQFPHSLHGCRNLPSQASSASGMILYHVFDHEVDGGLPVEEAAKHMGCE